MKNSRKKDLRNIRQMLCDLNAEIASRMSEVQSALEDLNEELNEQFDNLSERSQEGEAGERIQSDIDDLEYIISDVEDFTNSVDECPDNSPFAEIFQQIDDLLEKEY